MRNPFGALLKLVLAGSMTAGAALAVQDRADPWLEQPVDDATFRVYLQFLAYDPQVPFELARLDEGEDQGFKQTHLVFQSTPGVRVFARLLEPRGTAEGKRPAVILLHGGGPRGKDGRGTRRISTILVRAGWTVLAIDMQHFGERATDLLETYTEKEKHERLYNQPAVYLSWMTQNVKDVRRSFDLLVEHWNADPQRIVLIGFSRGAQVAPIAGGAEPRLAAVAMVHGGHFDALEREHLPAACPANYIGRISPRPLLMINARRDADYDRESQVVPLYERARPPKQLFWSDTVHGTVTEEDISTMVRWLRERLE